MLLSILVNTILDVFLFFRLVFRGKFEFKRKSFKREIIYSLDIFLSFFVF